MTGDKQNQKVGQGGVAVQSARDTNIKYGLSTEDMRAIVETMAEQLPTYAAIAASIVEEGSKHSKIW